MDSKIPDGRGTSQSSTEDNVSIELSVIIPAYNCESFISACFKSIFSGLEMCDEVIVVDDGSTDGTYAACQSFVDERLTIVRQENGGASSARNAGIARAHGRYLMFVDADDLLVDGWREVLGGLSKENEDMIVYTGMATSARYGRDQLVKSVTDVGGLAELKWLTSPCSRVYRRDFIVENGILFNTQIINGEDALFNLSVILLTDRILFKPQSFYRYRIHNASSTHGFDSRFFDSNEIYLELVERLTTTAGIDESIVNEIVDVSFARSVVIAVARIALLESESEIKDAITLMYASEPFVTRLRCACNTSRLSPKERVVFQLATVGRAGLGVQAARMLRRLRAKETEELWIEI